MERRSGAPLAAASLMARPIPRLPPVTMMHFCAKSIAKTMLMCSAKAGGGRLLRRQFRTLMTISDVITGRLAGLSEQTKAFAYPFLEAARRWASDFELNLQSSKITSWKYLSSRLSNVCALETSEVRYKAGWRFTPLRWQKDGPALGFEPRTTSSFTLRSAGC
jgi:hypothetical protein